MTEELRILLKIRDVELKAKSSESGFSYATILGPFPSVCALQSWSWDKAIMNETKEKKRWAGEGKSYQYTQKSNRISWSELH